VPEQESVMDCQTTEAECHTEVFDTDKLARQITQSFYSMLNQHDACHLATQLVQHFWHDCDMVLYVCNEMGSYNVGVTHNADNVVQLICNNRVQYNLYFNPNLLPAMVKANIQDDGLFTVAASGTIHQSGTCVQSFHQLFVLIRDPLAGNSWKIKHTEIQMNKLGN
jgi:hypothetical protein